MALVGQAAMVAQFAGVDAYGLIKMIAEAAQMVRRNRSTCLQLARRAKMIGDLLHQLHSAQLMQQPETRNPVEQLEETLRRALLLVRSCQGRGYLYRCFMGSRHADELREVQGEITFYLQLFPLVSYVDTTLTWVRLLNKGAPEPSCKEAPVVRPYFVPSLFLSPDEWCLVVIQEVYFRTVYTRFTSSSLLVKVVISTNPCAELWHLYAGVNCSATD
ncbi:cell number regulator 13-like [Lolium rigidum]|uniref:cell number regulator 13-like n=1 Tax=Lolium rigidum TaxID=89674 RepID=UPI001F5D48FF|nr:cell number regulator 13-like [Lolium rigidum]